MDDVSQIRSLLHAQFGIPESLYVMVVKRLRAHATMFGDNVKLSLRQVSEEQWAKLPMPYLMVFPTVTRIRAVEVDQPAQMIMNPRSITFIAQLDAHGSEHEWKAADQMELAEKQLIDILVNWAPMPWYKPTVYAGMRLEGTHLPNVKVAFVFTFFEQIVFEEQIAALECGDGDIIDRLHVRVMSGCPVICDPCGGELEQKELARGRLLEPEPPGAQWPMIGGWPYPPEQKND